MLRDLDEVRTELARWATADIVRVPTGFRFFDDRTQGGMAPGQLMFALARTGVGKTWLLTAIACNNPKVPTVFFSLEMHGRYILERLASVYTDTPTKSIEATLRAKGKSHAIDQTVAGLPLLMIEDEPDLGLEDMSEVLEDYAKKYGQPCRLVLLDYLELVRSFGATQMAVVQELARGLKNFAREHDVAVICLHQVKRGEGNNGHKPLDMTDGKFGSEESADYVLGMYKPNLNPTLSQELRESLDNDIRLQFLKTRTGGGIHPDGVQHHWNGETGRISQLDWKQPSTPSSSF